MTVLVTGVNGFTGRALVRYLNTAGVRDIIGISRTVPETYGTGPGIRTLVCDLTDQKTAKEVISKAQPDLIIHLAGLNHGPQEELERVNAGGTENLLYAIMDANPACRVLIVSSSAVYGYAGRKPIGEDIPARPLSGYGASKDEQERVGLAYHARRGTQVAIARPFNLVGPGQPGSFLCGRIVQQIGEIEHGKRKNIELLETRSYRDFIDVRDAVRAYWAIMSHPDFERTCSGKAFNIGSGNAYAVSDVISFVEEITGRTYVVELPEDPPVVPVPFQKADISRIRGITGWQPEISLKASLADMIEAERKRPAGKIFEDI